MKDGKKTLVRWACIALAALMILSVAGPILASLG